MKALKVLLLGLVTVGCTEDIDSADIRTSGIYAEFEAISESDDGPTRAFAALRSGGKDSNTFVVLTGEDSLIATADGEAKTLSEYGDIDDTYAVNFDTQAEDTEFVFDFLRGDADEDATSTVTLPPPFKLGGLDLNEEHSRSEDLVLTYDGPVTNDEVTYSVDGDCIFRDTGEISIASDKTLRIPASAFDAKPDEDETTCGANVQINLKRSGTLDSKFDGGRIEGIQSRNIPFVLTP